MENRPENAVLLYCDAGCHLNPKGVERLQFYVDELNADPLGVKAFYAHCGYTEVTEKKWMKGDVFEYFNCRDRKDVTDSQQVAATQILLRKVSSAVELVREWKRIMYEQFSLIDDTPSKSPNLPGYLENRHDQSIFSLLYKLRGGIPLPSGETDSADYTKMDAYPIWNMRDRGYKDRRFFARLKRFIKARIFMSKVWLEKMKDKLFRTGATSDK